MGPLYEKVTVKYSRTERVKNLRFKIIVVSLKTIYMYLQFVVIIDVVASLESAITVVVISSESGLTVCVTSAE